MCNGNVGVDVDMDTNADDAVSVTWDVDVYACVDVTVNM